MTTPAPAPDPGQPSQSGISMGIAGVILLISAAAIFVAGVSLGGGTRGRDADERSALEAFTEAYRAISGEFVGETRPDQLVEAAIRGMFETLDDPYSAFMGSDEFDATLSGIAGEFEGIGARMTTEDDAGAACEPIGDGCDMRVTDVLSSSSAEAAGLLADDLVRAVDARSLDQLTIDDAVLLIRGPRGSEVTLTLVRAGTELPLTITRAVIRSQDVRSAVLADGEVGYLRIDGFGNNADEDFGDELRAFIDADIDALVIDVRENPGGFVDTAIAIASQFVGSGPIMWEENAAGDRRPFEARGGGLATDEGIEVVVVIDDGSASASEILAGALGDAGRATLVGERTFGKGTVQEWTQLPGENGGFRLSVARWLTRDESSIDGGGIEPDIAVARSGARYRPDGTDVPEDDEQLAAALAILVGEDMSAAAAAPSPA